MAGVVKLRYISRFQPRARPRTGLGREMEALGRAVEAAARRRQWVEALHAAQALVRMERRFPEVERRTFALEVRQVLARPILDGFVELALRVPEGAAASTVGALLHGLVQLPAGSRVAAILSGGNLNLDQLRGLRWN